MVPRRRIGGDVRLILYTILTGWDSNRLRSDRRDLCGKRARRTIQPLWSSDRWSDYRGRRKPANWWRNKRLGNGVLDYQKGIPLVLMILTLLVFPQGLASLPWIRVVTRIRRISGRLLGGIRRLSARGLRRC